MQCPFHTPNATKARTSSHYCQQDDNKPGELLNLLMELKAFSNEMAPIMTISRRFFVKGA
jgi:hypothetical protein